MIRIGVLEKAALVVALAAAAGVSAGPVANAAPLAPADGAAAAPQVEGKRPAPPPVAPDPRPPGPRQRPMMEKPVRCALPSGESISADSILADLKEGKEVVLFGRIILGNLDADQIGPPADERKAALRVVRGKLRLESCRIDGRVLLGRTVLAKGIELPCTEIRGDLDLTDAIVEGALDASHTRILGQVRLTRTETRGSILFSSAHIEDRFDLTGARVPDTVNLQFAELAGELDLGRSVLGGIELFSAQIGGQTTARDLLTVGDFSARDASFAKGLTVDGSHIVGKLDLSGAHGAGGFSLSECVVGEDLFFDVATKGPVILSGLEIARDLSLFDGSFSAVTFEGIHVGRATEFEGARFDGKVVLRDSDFGPEFTATDAVFAGECEMRKVKLSGDDPLEGAIFKKAPVLFDTQLAHPPTVSTDDQDSDEPDDESGDEDSP